MPKRKEPEGSSSSPAKNMEHSGARPPRVPPSVVVLALEAPTITATRSLIGRAGSRSSRGGRSGGDTISAGRGGRSGGDSKPGRGGKSSRLSLRLPTKQRKLLLKEKARENILSMIRESSTSTNNSVAHTPEKNIADQGLPPPNPTVMVPQSEAGATEAFANASALDSGASTQEDPSKEPGGSGKSDKASSL